MTPRSSSICVHMPYLCHCVFADAAKCRLLCIQELLRHSRPSGWPFGSSAECQPPARLLHSCELRPQGLCPLSELPRGSRFTAGAGCPPAQRPPADSTNDAKKVLLPEATAACPTQAENVLCTCSDSRGMAQQHDRDQAAGHGCTDGQLSWPTATAHCIQYRGGQPAYQCPGPSAPDS